MPCPYQERFRGPRIPAAFRFVNPQVVGGMKHVRITLEPVPVGVTALESCRESGEVVHEIENRVLGDGVPKRFTVHVDHRSGRFSVDCGRENVVGFGQDDIEKFGEGGLEFFEGNMGEIS